ncbi:MAG: NAD(P)H-dependent oxidoreductase subunit E [Acidobacteriota bacterium]|nr:NAD(P)H-dependent oxidoreductase subunit E [Acidobacteriota bacterium]
MPPPALPHLIHELTVLQEREGWLSEASLRSLAERLGVPLHRLESVSTFYTHFRRQPPASACVEVCRDLPCALAGGAEALVALRPHFESGDAVEIREVSCLGRCDRAPAACVGHRVVRSDDPVDVSAAIAGEAASTPLPTARWAADPYGAEADHYGALRQAIGCSAEETLATLEATGLRGMGGAGFPLARKWSIVRAEEATPKYVICNADESEPGTFKDRQILADLPHLVIEGMALGGFCVGAERGTVFIRHEYGPERESLERAIVAAREVGALGENIFGSGFSFDIDIFVSPGGYILGEETALLECMEGRRGEPRNKPPFPGSVGLFGQPTLINNVETLAHAAAITARGADWWQSLGTRGKAGHKFMAVSGDVAKPQVVLVGFGTTLAELLGRCGGMREGKELAAVAPGGASSKFLGPDKLETPLDFSDLAEAGSMLGSGAAIFVAKGRDLLEVGLNVARFFRNESCGKCVPCRLGTQKAVALVEQAGGTTPEVEELLGELDLTLQETSICGLGQVALAPLRSVIERFPDQIRRDTTRD